MGHLKNNNDFLTFMEHFLNPLDYSPGKEMIGIIWLNPNTLGEPLVCHIQRGAL